MNEVHDTTRHDEDMNEVRKQELRWWMYCGPNSRKIRCLAIGQDLCLTTKDPTQCKFLFAYYQNMNQITQSCSDVCFIQRGWSHSTISCPQAGGVTGTHHILTHYIPSPELYAQELPRPKHGEFYTKSEAAIVFLGGQTAQRKEIKEKNVNKGLAPSVKALDRVIDPLQRGELIDDGHFPTKKRKRNEDLTEEKDKQSQPRLKFVQPTIFPFEV